MPLSYQRTSIKVFSYLLFSIFLHGIIHAEDKLQHYEYDGSSNEGFYNTVCVDINGNCFIAKDVSTGDFVSKNSILTINGLDDNPLQFMNIFGGYHYNSNGNASVMNTHLVIDGNVRVTQDIYGAYAFTFNGDAAAQGTVIVNSGVFKTNNTGGAFVHGAYAYSEKGNVRAEGQAVLNGGDIQGDVYGAKVVTDKGDGAANGQIVINDANLFWGNITGAHLKVKGGAVTGQGSIVINGGDLHEMHMFGTYISGAPTAINSTGNVISINDFSNISSFNRLYGAYNMSLSDPDNVELFAQNTLNIASQPIKVGELGNFNYYNFYITDKNKNLINQDTALLTIGWLMSNDNTIVNGVQTPNQSHVKIVGIDSSVYVTEGDEIILIDQGKASIEGGDEGQKGLAQIFGDLEGNRIRYGLIREVDVSYQYRSDNGQIVAVFRTVPQKEEENTAPEGDVKPEEQTKPEEQFKHELRPLSDGRSVGLMSAMAGADLLWQSFNEGINSRELSSIFTIAAVEVGRMRYSLDSPHIKSSHYDAIFGVGYKGQNGLSLAAFFEYGAGNYDVYNGWTDSRISNGGDITRYGGALAARLDIDHFFVQGALRAGQVTNKFHSSSMIEGADIRYQSQSNYYGANIGFGHHLNISDAVQLTSSLSYVYTTLDADNVIILGDQVNFDRSVSSKLQLKEQIDFNIQPNVDLFGSLIYEYEFNGKTKSNVVGGDNRVFIETPSLKGSTGILEVGVSVKPSMDQNFAIDLMARGYAGKRKGASGYLTFNYHF